MAYKDEDKKRATTRERVKRHRAKIKGVTKGVTCPDCEGRGFIEENLGLLQVGCARCKGTGEI